VPRRLIIALLTALALTGPAASAGAATTTPGSVQAAPAGSDYVKPAAAAPQEDVAVPLFPIPQSTHAPAGFAISPLQAVALAKRTPAMQAIHRHEHPLLVMVLLMPRIRYEVDFWYHLKPVAAVVVDSHGRVGHIYRGALIFGLYARGNYSDVFDSPWVYLPFGFMFLLPLILMRGATWLDRLDLAVVLSFGVSYALFNNLVFDAAVWLAYPPLIYLLVRLLMRGMRPARRRRPIDVALPTWVLVAGVVLLTAGRIGATLAPKLVMDVAYASLIGAYRILHGQSIYFPSLGHPDTYGAVNYLAYAPFEAIWPVKLWWTYLPAARAATITFDVLTTGGLVLLGTRLRTGRAGLRLGLLFAWLWAACPFSVLGIVKGTNDGLLAMFAVMLMLALSSPMRRGAVLGLATAAKFFPGVLLPVVMAGRGGREHQPLRRALVGFVLAAAGPVALFLPPGGLQEVWSHTIGYQLTRPDIFSPWALHPALAPIKDALEVAAVGLSILCYFRPRGPRSTAQVAALAGAVTIAVQLPALHWFYLYIVWFLPLLIIAVLANGPAPARLSAVPAALDTPAEDSDLEGDARALPAAA